MAKAQNIDNGNSSTREMEDYMREVDDIKQGKSEEEPDEEGLKTPDEGEEEAEWLKDAGFAELVSKFEEGKEVEDDIIDNETSSLTRGQAAAVKKRINTLNATLRKKHKKTQPPGKTDVRDLFSAGPIHDSEGSDKGSEKSGGEPSSPRTSVVLRHDKGNGKPRERFKNRSSYSMGGGSNALDTGSKDESSNPSSPMHSPTSVEKDGNGRPVASIKDSMGLGKTILQDFKIMEDPLGVTYVNDLGTADIPKLRNLALLEMTAVFDACGIIYTRRKGKKKVKEHGIFGVPLQILYEHDMKKQNIQRFKIPLIVKKLVNHLYEHGIKEEGILRVPGSAARIKSLRQEIEEKFNAGKFSWEDVRPNDAAGLLKQFIRELPAPLLSFEYLDAFAKVEKITGQKERIEALNLLVLLLPDVHRDTLLVILRFLRRVVDTSNRMTLNNVAMIMAPNLFLVNSGRRSKGSLDGFELTMAANTANIVKMLIQHQDVLFTVPSLMISQVRHQNEADLVKKSRDRPLRRFLRRDKGDAYKKPPIKNEGDFKKGIIRVKFDGVNVKSLQLNDHMTAVDVIKSFHPSGPAKVNGKRESCFEGLDIDRQESVFMYEVGGNISERRLDPKTIISKLYKVNPNTEWMIKD